MKVHYKPVNDILRGQSKIKGGIRFANNPGGKMLRRFLRDQYRRMVRQSMLAKFKNMPDCVIGHRIDMVSK